MIINTKADYDAAPKDEQDRVKAQLTAGINRWGWIDGEWVLQQYTAGLERFGLTLADVPKPPTPDKPTYNPDEREKERAIAEAVEARSRAYQAESDPLFFKVQRGEVTEQTWLDAVAAIKKRYPKPE